MKQNQKFSNFTITYKEGLAKPQEKSGCNKKKRRSRRLAAVTILLTLALTGCGRNKSDTLTITNVSYDPTREFYEAYNPVFEKYYENKFGKKVEVIQSHGGSGAQARSVVEGCNADVVTLALEHDITLIEQTGLIEPGWQKEFDKDSAPYTSTIVFLVRKGNPKNIQDWDDLIQSDVEVDSRHLLQLFIKSSYSTFFIAWINERQLFYHIYMAIIYKRKRLFEKAVCTGVRHGFRCTWIDNNVCGKPEG